MGTNCFPYQHLYIPHYLALHIHTFSIQDQDKAQRIKPMARDRRPIPKA